MTKRKIAGALASKPERDKQAEKLAPRYRRKGHSLRKVATAKPKLELDPNVIAFKTGKPGRRPYRLRVPGVAKTPAVELSPERRAALERMERVRGKMRAQINAEHGHDLTRDEVRLLTTGTAKGGA